MRVTSLFILLISSLITTAQSDTDARFIKQIHDHALSSSKCYDWLRDLTYQAGPRLSGSEAYDVAVNVTSNQMMEAGATKLDLQPCTVNVWQRGMKEYAHFTTNGKAAIPLKVTSLGNTEGTGLNGVEGEVIEVQSLDEVRAMSAEQVKGKIIFYNRPMNPTFTTTFSAYGSAVDQRGAGPSVAAEKGAAAVLVRSMTLRQDDYPHTGAVAYKEGVAKIPAMAVSTNDANVLSKAIKAGKTTIFMRNTAHMSGKKEVMTVIGEIKGSEFPDEIIVVGGHLDAWDLAQGAHDDGTGCVHAMQVLHTLTSLNYKPKRTIRCVLYANEENGLSGGLEYARVSNTKKERHIAALESDSGGFSPRGFSFDADTSVFKTHYRKINAWLPLFEGYGLQFSTGGSGADISPLKSQKGLLIGLRPDSQRYFDYHHTSIDTFDAVNKRELELGAAAMTSLIYMIDKYGL